MPARSPTSWREHRAARWRVFVVSTPLGLRFLDRARLEQQAGEPVRSDFQMPGEGKELSRADAVIAAPMTFNTINKWALGITDNFATSLLCELTGYGVTLVAVPMLKPPSPGISPSRTVSTGYGRWASELDRAMGGASA
ncbi:flavoprotein [Nonomuraea wenchangensis]